MSAKRPRIAICGLHDECSTFCPHQATADDFRVTRGQELLNRYPWLQAEAAPVDEGGYPRGWEKQVDWIPILHARSVPSGPVTMEAYTAWKEEILAGLAQQGPFDGIYFDIHGAMYVTGMEDMEGDLITAIRQVVGPNVLVSCTMDLHGNVSPTLFTHCDMLTCFRLAPHEDTWETRERGARLLVERLVGGLGKPAKALVYVPILLPGEKTSTRLEPAKSLYQRIPQIESLPGISDASIWIGYAWADEPRCKAAIVVYGDDQKTVTEQAQNLAKELWKVRNDFQFVAPADQFPICLQAALNATTAERPYFISDSGDNPGAGGADDVTYALDQLLNCPEVISGPLQTVAASIVDPKAVKVAEAAGVGATVTLQLGGKIDPRSPGELTVTAQVEKFADDPLGGRSVCLAVGNLKILVTSQRTQFSELADYRRLGVEPTEMDIICVKIGYLEPELHAIARGWMLALTPGGVDQDLLRLEYKRIDRPMFPFDPDMPDPSFTVITQ